jgi:hypothetical protein
MSKPLVLDFTAKGEARLFCRSRVVFKNTDLEHARTFVRGYNQEVGIEGTKVWRALRADGGPITERGFISL